MNNTETQNVHPENPTPTTAKLYTETGEEYQIPQGGSLGILALGYSGVMLWRLQRKPATEKQSAVINKGAETKNL